MDRIRKKYLKIVCLCILITKFGAAEESVKNEVSNPFTFFEEIKNLGNEYFQSRNRTKFIPLVESLLQRIEEYTKIHNNSADEKNLLRYLYTVSLSELVAMRGYYTIISCVDIVGYMNLSQNYIREAQQISDFLLVNTDQERQYKKDLEYKLKYVNEFIGKYTTPKIMKVTIKTENEIINLIDEKNNEELKTSMIYLKMLGLMNTTSTFLEVLGRISNFVTSTIGKNVLIAEIFSNEKMTTEEMISFAYILKQYLSEFSSKLKNWQSLFLKQMDDIEVKIVRYLEDNSSEELSAVKQKMSTINSEIKNSNVTIEYELIDTKRNELKEFVVDKRSKLEQKNQEQNSNNLVEQIRILQYAELLCDLTVITSNIYDKIRDDENKIVAVSKITMENEFTVWKETEKNISRLILQHIQDIDNTRAKIFENISNYKHTELNINEWHIQNLMAELKVMINQRMNGFLRNNDLQHCYDRLNVGLDTITDVYNRIDTYTVIAKLSAYFDMCLENKPTDTINIQISSLTQIIRTNIALQRYEREMFIFNQNQFPFSNVYMSKFELSADFQINDTETFVNQAIKHIDYLKEQVALTRKSEGEFSGEISKQVEFNSINSNNMCPFYTWNYDEIKTEINDLLYGKAIIVTSHQMKELKQNALKFDRIGIRLKLENQTDQLKLDEALVTFGIRMTIQGNSHFKCGHQFYSIPFGHSTIAYTPGKNDKPRSRNEVYRKIMEGDLFLSPYATWKIQLESKIESSTYESLTLFMNKTIDLELIGRGQYFENEASFTHQICTGPLDKYHQIDNTLSDAV